MRFIFVDSNIFIRLLTQATPKFEFKFFKDLELLCKKNVVKLLVPEIIIAEIEKQSKKILIDYDKIFADITSRVTKKDDWNEIKDSKEIIIDTVSQVKHSKDQLWTKNYPELYNFLKSQFVTLLPITKEIEEKANRRIQEGRFPRIKKAGKDAEIIESLIDYFNGVNIKDSTFHFCSENHNDFAEKVIDGNKRGEYKLHNLLQDGLPQTIYSLNLESLMTFAQGYEYFFPKGFKDPELQKDQDIRKIQIRLDNINENESDILMEESIRLTVEFEKLFYDRLSKKFKADIMPCLPNDIRQIRTSLCDNISKILSKCRRYDSWDDRSEIKLSQWIEYVPENMIPYTSLANLFRIEENVQEYLEIHK